MILFIAPNPYRIKEHEGFLQRVEAIDKLFSGESKIYFDDLKNTQEQARALIDARIIYVHSVYNANKILRSYPRFAHKIITDLHGVVPEEEEYANNWEMVALTKEAEKTVFRYGHYFIAVTNAMVEHFEAKYPKAVKQTWIVLPVVDNLKYLRKKRIWNLNRKTVIYAGGVQPWQNIDKIKNTIIKTKDKYSFIILTHSPEAFTDLSGQNNITISSVKPDEVKKYYKKAELGFILREDNLVNRVACPTKLIEYIAYGVLPIVLTESIGDFKKMGYSFITLKDFLNSDISYKAIHEGININYQVYDNFTKQIKESVAKLLSLSDSIKVNHKNTVSQETVSLEIEYQKEHSKILIYEYQIGVYKNKISDYANAIEYYRSKEAINTDNSNN